jgi:hypothetical protein
MTETNGEDELTPDPTVETGDSALPGPTRTGHGKMPDEITDDMYALAAERERAEAGLIDYVPDDVPPAVDPLPDGASEAADLAQRGLVEEETEE